MLGVTQTIPSYQPNAGSWIRILVFGGGDVVVGIVASGVVDDDNDDNNHCSDMLAFWLHNPNPTQKGFWCPNAASLKGHQPLQYLA